MKKMLQKIAAFLIASFPFVSYGAFYNIQGFLFEMTRFLNLLVPVITGLALLFFLWGLTKFIRKAGDEKAYEEGRNIVIWGIVSLAVMVSVWGIVKILQRSLDIPPVNQPPLLR